MEWPWPVIQTDLAKVTLFVTIAHCETINPRVLYVTLRRGRNPMTQSHEQEAALGRLLVRLLGEGRQLQVFLWDDGRPAVDQGGDRPMLTVDKRGFVEEMTGDVSFA